MTQALEGTGIQERRLLLAGEHVDSDETLSVAFPYDGSEIARVGLASEGQLEQALSAAAAAERETAALPPFRRAALLHAAAALVAEREDELARQMTLETGNAIWETHLEVQRTGEILTFAAEEARRITGEIVPIDAVSRGEGRYG